MGKDSKKKKRIRTYALLSAVAVLAIALGVLLGGKISGVLFSGQDLFRPDDRTVQASPLPTASSFVPVIVPSIDATQTPALETILPTMIETTPQPTQTPGPYEELAKVADTGMMNGIVNIMFIGVDYESARINNWSGKGAQVTSSSRETIACRTFAV